MGFLNKKVTQFDRGYKYYIEEKIVTIVDDKNSKYIFNYLAYYDNEKFILSNGLTQYTFYYANFSSITDPNSFINLLTQAFFGTSVVIGSVSVPSNFIPYGYGGTINTVFGAVDVNDFYIHTFYGIVSGNNIGSFSIDTNISPFNPSINYGVIGTGIGKIQAALDSIIMMMGYAKGEAIYTVLKNNEIAIWVSPNFSSNIPSDFIHMYGGSSSSPGSYTNKVDFTELLSITINDIKP